MELPPQLELTHAWREISSQLRRLVGDSNYELWLSGIEVQAFDGDRIVLTAPQASREWVSKRFGRILETCVRTVIGPTVAVAFAPEPSGETSTKLRSERLPGQDSTPRLNPRYSFDQFVIGDSNRLAHGASLAVAELPGQAYNPLFLHAPPGLGKTHLLHAIGNYVQAFGDGAAVRYTTVEEFTNHFITSLQRKAIEHFKQAYRNVDVLLIDDVQFLASKARTEEEFFHTFNAVYETGRQLVLTCDRLPRQLLAVEERLRERFESGLVADIHPPDFATRVTILRKRAALDRVALADPAVLELIAERITSNIRALEGALIRVVAYHSLTRRPIDLALTREVLDQMYPTIDPGAPTIDRIQAEVADFYGLSVADLVSTSRTAPISWARQVAIFLARELTNASLGAIGKAFGGRNHATVLHACKRVTSRLEDDQQCSTELQQLHATLLA